MVPAPKGAEPTLRSTESQTLALLEAIERDSNLSQRDLARITGLNVAKVNFLIKKFVDKGHVKLKNVSRNPNKLRYLYFLTPQGALVKTRLAYNFMRRALKQFSLIESRIRETLQDLDATSILLVGANEITEIVLKVADEIGDIEVNISIVEFPFAQHRAKLFPC